MVEVEVVAYATKNYERITKLWKRSQIFPNTFLTEGPSEQTYVECIESKMRNLLEFEPGTETKFIISSDVDVVFFSNNIPTTNVKKILFMRDAVKTNLNAGFFIVEKEYFCNILKPFLKNMLLEGTWKTLKHYEQSYMNEYLPRDDWDFIPDECVYMPFVEKNMSKVLFYHAICVPDKERALELAMKTKRYQVHLCFHDGVENFVESVLYRHPYMIPYRLHSTKYFESEFFMNVDVDMSADYIGMVTYSIVHKPNIFKTNILKILESATEDIVAFHVLPSERIEETDKDHPKFTRIWKRLAEKLGVSPECHEPMFFCNYWVAKPEVVKKYQEFIKKAVELLEEDSENVYDDACYVSGKLSKEKLIEITGRPHYTYHPFVLERLPCLFTHVNSFSVRCC